MSLRIYPVSWERTDPTEAPDYSAALAAAAVRFVNDIGEALGADPVDATRALQILESLGFRFHVSQHTEQPDSAQAVVS